MIVPSGYTSFPSREALIATSLPRIARRSLRVPSSRATEINGQSRYPGGILTPKIGAASPSACPDAGAMQATPPASAATATSTENIGLIRCLLVSRAARMVCALPFTSRRFAERSESGANFGSEELGLLPRREVSALVDLIEVDQVAIGAPGPCLRRSIDLPRKYRDGH